MYPVSLRVLKRETQLYSQKSEVYPYNGWNWSEMTIYPMAAPPRRPTKSIGQVASLSFLVICLGLGAMVTMGFLLYSSVVMTPALINRMAKIYPAMNNNCAHTNGMFKLEAFPRPEEEKVHPPRPLKILIGIMTMATKTERRHLLRMAYRAQSTEIAHIDVQFVIGKLKDGTEKTVIGLENLVYHDILELECEENMNHGKTFSFFSTVADIVAESGARNRTAGPDYHYVMKTDDDSYVRIDNLAKHLLPLSRTDLYYGYVLPCENQDPYKWYMAGMGYVISWDLVEWIRNSTIPRNDFDGTEDQLVGKWFDEGGKAKNRKNDKPLFYDHPDFKGGCAHELIPETILIHQVKTLQRWADVLSFFERDRLNLSPFKDYIPSVLTDRNQ